MDIRYKQSLQPMEGPHPTERLRPQSPNTSLREPILEEHDRTLTPAKRPQRYSWNQGHEHVYSHSHNESKPKLPTFDGKKDTWEPFLMQFRLMSNSYNWSDRKFREQLIFALREKALLFASNLPQRTAENTESLLQAMGQRFGQCLLPETQRANLHNLKKQAKESLQ